MNLNAHITLSSLNPKILVRQLAPYRLMLITVGVLGLLGYTGLQLSRIQAVPTDESYVSAHADTAKTVNLRLKPATVAQLKSLRDPGGTTATVPVGKRDPFSL